MNNPTLYERNNKVQRLEVERLLNKYSSNFKWRSDGTDSLLDLGCGSGDVTIDLILPILPTNFERLVGVDLSTKMIEHARKKYPLPKVSFEQFDLEMKLEDQSLYGTKQFDFITSFFCLLWVQNQENALKSISKLLKIGGSALLAFPSRACTFTAFERLVKDEKWAKYMQDFENFIPIYHYVDSPVEEFRRLLLLSGFSEFSVDVIDNEYIFSGAEEAKNFYRAINPFIERIPMHEQDEYLNDMLYACNSKLTYQELIVYMQKTSSN